MRDNTTKNKRTKNTRLDNEVHPYWAMSLGPLQTKRPLYIAQMPKLQQMTYNL